MFHFSFCLFRDHEIRSRKAKRVVIYTDKEETTNAISNTSDSDQAEEVSLIRYSQQSDFRRDLIKGSMRAQRRKTVSPYGPHNLIWNNR